MHERDAARFEAERNERRRGNLRRKWGEILEAKKEKNPRERELGLERGRGRKNNKIFRKFYIEIKLNKGAESKVRFKCR